jgi:hypothetical protein
MMQKVIIKEAKHISNYNNITMPLKISRETFNLILKILYIFRIEEILIFNFKTIEMRFLISQKALNYLKEMQKISRKEDTHTTK